MVLMVPRVLTVPHVLMVLMVLMVPRVLTVLMVPHVLTVLHVLMVLTVLTGPQVLMFFERFLKAVGGVKINVKKKKREGLGLEKKKASELRIGAFK